MSATNLKRLAKPYSAFGGAVVFWLLPFRSVGVASRQRQLELIEPRFQYVHKETGEATTDEPPEHRRLLSALAEDAALAQFEDALRQSPWRVIDLWTPAHNNFVAIDTLTVDIEFAPAPDDVAPDVRAEIEALAEFWRGAGADVSRRWTLWNLLIGSAVSDAWVLAYRATREQRYRAPTQPVVDEEDDDTTDPLSSSGGSTGAASTSASVAVSMPSSKRSGRKNKA